MKCAKPDWAPYSWALPFFGSFLVYLITVAPTVTFWDSGELISASWCLGISHQPGYPLFCIVGKLFSFLPFGNVAYRANLLSAFFSSFSLLALYFLLIEISRRPVLAALAALLPAFMKAYWSQAVVTKPLALNSLFVTLLALTWVLAARKKLSPERYFAASGLVFGLGVVNHQSLILYAPALIISWAVLQGPDLRQRLKLSTLSLFFIMLGLCVYLYLPIRATAGPLMDLGHPDNYGRFAWTVKWGEYFRAGIPFNNILALVKKINIMDPRIIIGAPAALLLIFRMLRREWRLYLPLLVFLLVYLAGISMQTLGSEEDNKFGLAAKYFIPVFVMAVPLIYAEAVELWDASKIWKALIAAVFAGFIVLLLARNFFVEDNSRHFFAYDYAQDSLKSTGERGVLFTWGDNGAFPLWYLHDVEKYRDDAVIIHAPLMTYDWYLRDVNGWLGADIKYLDPYFLGENVYRVYRAVTPGRTVAYDFSTVKFLGMDQNALKVRGLVSFEGPTPPGEPWKFYVLRNVDDPDVYKDPMAENITEIYNYQNSLRSLR
ncbi:MAG: DUF2723 domain-containing protein [Nitrospirota bacterium]